MEFFVNPNGSLFRLTKGEYDFIIDLIREDNPVHSDAAIDSYSKEEFLDEVYMTERKYEELIAVLRNKKNIILQGAPGVGKTFSANRLAYAMMKENDDDRIEFVQFHQNYSYEDFVMGYKPVEDGFELKYGVFYRFCQKAANHPDNDYKMSGNKIGVHTLDLNMEFSEIRRQLDGIAERYFADVRMQTAGRTING